MQGLVGYTGFVGGTLLRAAPFDALYNSSNAAEMRGRDFDLLVVAGAPAEKWKANADPERDWSSIGALIDNLSTVGAASAILISTIDVYPDPNNVDEASVVDPAAQHAYGRHRLRLEDAFRARFPAGLVVRLPALFGTGLKKNAIFDLLHDHETWKLHARARFQFYGLDRLWADLERFRASGIPLINVVAEPVTLAEVCREAFGIEFDNDPGTPPARYDVKTRHASALGGRDTYLYDRATILRDLASFVARERRREHTNR